MFFSSSNLKIGLSHLSSKNISLIFEIFFLSQILEYFLPSEYIFLQWKYTSWIIMIFCFTKKTANVVPTHLKRVATLLWTVFFNPARRIYAFLDKKIDWYPSHKNMIWSGSKTNFVLSECQNNVCIFTKSYLVGVYNPFFIFLLFSLPFESDLNQFVSFLSEPEKRDFPLIVTYDLIRI